MGAMLGPERHTWSGSKSPRRRLRSRLPWTQGCRRAYPACCEKPRRRGLFDIPPKVGHASICLLYQAQGAVMSDKQDAHRSRHSSLPFPARVALERLGRDLSIARRKRRISTADMASRLFVSRDTVWRLERGDPSVSVGTLATAVYVLQLHDRLAALAAPDRDALGLDLEAAALPRRIVRRKPSRDRGV
jgi:DNA-binding XRE family transcriptional regulator